MFCKVCGKELNDNAVICIGCGCVVDQEKVNCIFEKKYDDTEIPSNSQNEKMKHYQIIGFVLALTSSLFLLSVPLIGQFLIGAYVMAMIFLWTGGGLSIYGLIKGKTEPTKIYSVLGIIFASCSFICCGVTFGISIGNDLVSYLYYLF